LRATDPSLGLGEGRTNTNFVAETQSGRFFVRLGADLPAYGVLRSHEQAAARAAAAVSISPAVIHTEPGAMVCRMIAGSPLTPAAVQAACSGLDPELLRQLVTALRTLHATAAPPELTPASPNACWSPPSLLRWLSFIETAGYTRQPFLCGPPPEPPPALLPGPLPPPPAPPPSGARRLVVAIDVFLLTTAGAPSPGSFCHMDLLPDNIVRGPAGLFLVDFEYAALGQPLLDLAILAMGADLKPAHEVALLRAYYDADGDGAALRAIAAFDGLKVLASLRETLWGVVAEVSGTSALSPAEATAYVDSNYAKLRACARRLGGGGSGGGELAEALRALIEEE